MSTRKLYRYEEYMPAKSVYIVYLPTNTKYMCTCFVFCGRCCLLNALYYPAPSRCGRIVHHMKFLLNTQYNSRWVIAKYAAIQNSLLLLILNLDPNWMRHGYSWEHSNKKLIVAEECHFFFVLLLSSQRHCFISDRSTCPRKWEKRSRKPFNKKANMYYIIIV